MLELAKSKKEGRRSLRLDGLHILYLYHHSDVKREDASHADAIVVQTDSEFEAMETLREVRSDSSRTISLKPVFVSSYTNCGENIRLLFDGTWTEEHPENQLQFIRKITGSLKNLNTEVHELDFRRALSQRICQYLYSRVTTLQPIRARYVNTGYAYSFISSIFKSSEGLKAIDLLDEMHQDGYVDGQRNEIIQSCNHCSGGYFNYRECCPSCGSPDLQSSDLIHHFVCAHVGPEDTFKNDDRLECPKCDKELRHIGIDYDKPSSMYTCRSCRNQFQNATVKALCVDCGNDNELSMLHTRSIKTYSITAKGEYLAKFGYKGEPAQKTEENSSILNPEIYKLFRKQELLKRQTGSASPLFEAELTILANIVDRFHVERRKMLQQEICSILTHYLEPTDLICSENPYSYTILMCNSDTKRAHLTSDVINNNISRLLADGLDIKDQTVRLKLTDISDSNDNA
ncbi:hypothetical protein [Rhodohalobacter sulfatireducens]|uniref:Thaumarchaeal output domain-containing protein n=1 Tax=Rhodohalobacter sulfatireducens TaxID=2911366 RepID=A0ABS9KC59_9BACT|nr:hypothetical protein [Rhodohalobacter sulfatireducens]MCG2588426.1 hypothetical protein [Rhodohalobacter sulfatireducens]